MKRSAIRDRCSRGVNPGFRRCAPASGLRLMVMGGVVLMIVLAILLPIIEINQLVR